MRPWTALVAPSLALALACGDRGAERNAPVAAPAAKAIDWSKPESALAMSADDAAARIGSLDMEAVVRWTVGRGPGSRTVTTVEQHHVRQRVDGAFEAHATIDPGGGPASENGRHVVFTGGMTYARGQWAPFRERPTDRGAGARRARDESFRIADDLLALFGASVALRESGSAAVLGRKARRFTVELDRARGAGPPPPPPEGRAQDPDTRARLEFLEGRVPLEASGEVVLDAETGVPLRVRFRGALGQSGDPALRADVDLDARITALGAAVAAVRAPKDARADERKPMGPARALEAAGLRERGRTTGGAERAAPEDEPAQ